MTPDFVMQGFGATHLHALAALPRLSVLNLRHVHWAEDAVRMGLPWLAARSQRLRILHAPQGVMVRLFLLCSRPALSCVPDVLHNPDAKQAPNAQLILSGQCGQASCTDRSGASAVFQLKEHLSVRLAGPSN